MPEEIIVDHDALPRELHGCQRFGIKYGERAEASLLEVVVSLPPEANIEVLLRGYSMYRHRV